MRQPVGHAGRVRALEAAQRLRIDRVAHLRRLVRPVLADLVHLGLHVVEPAHMAVVVDVRAGQRRLRVAAAAVAVHHHPELAVGRVAADRVADQPAFAPVPGRAHGQPLRRAVEVQVVEHQRLDRRIGVVAVDRRADGRQLGLVQHLVALEVEGPVAGAGVLGDHLLLRVDEALLGHALVPAGRDDADLRLLGRQRVDARLGLVLAGAQRDDELVDQRQDRADRGLEREAELHAVAQEGEAADRGGGSTGHRHPGKDLKGRGRAGAGFRGAARAAPVPSGRTRRWAASPAGGPCGWTGRRRR